MENFNVTENTNNKMYGKESSSVFSEAFRDMQGNNNSLYGGEKGGFKKALPQGFPELTIQEQLGDAGPSKDFTGVKKMIDDSLGNKKNVYGDKKEGIERLEKKEADLKQQKEDELIRQKKETALNDGLEFDKNKIPNKDGGTKDSVSSQSSDKPGGLEGGPKDKPAPANQAANDSASQRNEGTHPPDQGNELTHAPDKVINEDGGPKSKILTDDHGTPAPDKIVNSDGGLKEKILHGSAHVTPAPDKVVNQDGGEKYPAP